MGGKFAKAQQLGQNISPNVPQIRGNHPGLPVKNVKNPPIVGKTL